MSALPIIVKREFTKCWIVHPPIGNVPLIHTIGHRAWLKSRCVATVCGITANASKSESEARKSGACAVARLRGRGRGLGPRGHVSLEKLARRIDRAGALKCYFERATGRILCGRLKYATGYCKWRVAFFATIARFSPLSHRFDPPLHHSHAPSLQNKGSSQEAGSRYAPQRMQVTFIGRAKAFPFIIPKAWPRIERLNIYYKGVGVEAGGGGVMLLALALSISLLSAATVAACMLSSDRMGAPPLGMRRAGGEGGRRLGRRFLAAVRAECWPITLDPFGETTLSRKSPFRFDVGSLAFPYAPCRGKADDCGGSCASNLKLLGAMNCWCIMLVRACGWGRWKTVYKWLCLFSSSCVHLKKTSCALNIVPSLPGKGGQCGVSLVSSRNATG
ncbi:hypothetical protein Syun_031943 [Stephania yunnanensis]|uniref:Uncharacterized protein n=1 Tax=Stephania yunnanensis TaxID=152371 RepID=A0AAP0HAA5_9MAGN